ncbi:RNA polymerase sigma factor [Pseudonocardia humida]|uniref:RNA polymerase sigma factor n=1 Tax=Pseudonocardia humida TaxID=2800819 RepID=A0ABT0ZZT7_9PSEU|nr:RNA polymerase sigma factor [Pseudonocardia humida]MCO1656265.1 RNA polymerase sigma factor [Pseudonocardia humida]
MRAAVGDVVPPGPEPDSADAGLERALRAARDGDESAFAVLYRCLQPRLLRYAFALVGSEAEDVTAETWLHVARGIRGFVGDVDGFRGWVTTICRNRSIDFVRRRGRRPTDPVDTAALADLPDGQDASEEALGAIATRRAIARILALPEAEAEAVLLRAVVGLDGPTAARVLGKRSGAVRVAAHRGLRRLAQVLEDERTAAGGGDA